MGQGEHLMGSKQVAWWGQQAGGTCGGSPLDKAVTGCWLRVLETARPFYRWEH